MRLKFRITLLSDYHIGAGYGKGVIDSVILKDKDGIPIIRGTTLSGLLHQGMWELLQLDLLRHHRKCKQSGFSGNQYCMAIDEEHICPVCRILGSPIHPKRWNISSAMIEKPSILESGKIVWRNRVNPKLRTAEERKLFNEETAGGKISFIFAMDNESDDTRALEEASFIVAALRMIRYIGGSRRRGKGLCEFHLIEITPELPEIENIESTSSYEDKLLEIFKIKWLDNKELTIREKNEKIKQTREVTPTKKSFNLVLLTEEPLLIANRGEAGNRFQTTDYIPGYTILGALAWKIANRCDLTNEAIYEKFINLFRKGGIKISPLYPCRKIGNDVYPAIPSPLDFLTCKLHPGFESEDGHGVKGFAIDKDEPENCYKCLKGGLETPLEPLYRFVPLHPNPKTVEVEKREEMHITIEPETGKTRTGDLFSYTAIESEQYFIGTIEIENWVDFVALLGIDGSQDDISFELRIGKASSRGYGLAKIWLNEKNTGITFLGKPIEERVDDINSPITMTFLTDAILTDKWGRFYSTLDSEILKQILGVEVEVINTYVKTKSIDSFNAYLGLPKWRDYAFVAGSSIGFKVKSTINRDELIERFKKLENDGIGLRRDEGFGRVAFNHPIYNENRCSVRIRLEEFMRIHKPEEKIKNFENWWRECLTENLPQSDFSREEWRTIARWLKENSRIPLDEISKMFSKDLNFHKPEEITSLIEKKHPMRDKREFLSDKGEGGLKKLQDAFKGLSRRISQEDEEIREYIQFKAIEMLANFIESLREGET